MHEISNNVVCVATYAILLQGYNNFWIDFYGILYALFIFFSVYFYVSKGSRVSAPKNVAKHSYTTRKSLPF